MSSVYALLTRLLAPFDDMALGGGSFLARYVIFSGIMLVMVGKRKQGWEMAKWAAVGFILLQFVPTAMEFLVSLGTEMRTAIQAMPQ